MTEETRDPPPWIFLDTEFFDGIRLDFKNVRLTALSAHASQGHTRLVLPKVTEDEILTHIRAAVHLICTSDAHPLMRNSLIPAVKDRFAQFDPLLAEATAAFRDLLNRCSVHRLDTDRIPFSHIHRLYFDQIPPFHATEKKDRKSHFADAYAIAALKEWGAHRGFIAVVTKDNTFRAACTEPLQTWTLDDYIKALASLLDSSPSYHQVPESLDEGAPHPSYSHDERALWKEVLSKSVARRQGEIVALTEADFLKCSFFQEHRSDRGYNPGEVLRVAVHGISLAGNVDILAISETIAIFETMAEIQFEADVTVPNLWPGPQHPDEDGMELTTVDRTIRMPLLVQIDRSREFGVVPTFEGRLTVTTVDSDVFIHDADTENRGRRPYIHS